MRPSSLSGSIFPAVRIQSNLQSWDVDGMRYSGVRMCDVADGEIWLFAGGGLAIMKSSIGSRVAHTDV